MHQPRQQQCTRRAAAHPAPPMLASPHAGASSRHTYIHMETLDKRKLPTAVTNFGLNRPTADMLARSSMLSTLLTVHLWLLDFNNDETSLIYAWLSLTPETGGVWNMWNIVLRMVVLHRYGHWGVYHQHLLNLVELSWCVNVRYLARADSITDVYKSTMAPCVSLIRTLDFGRQQSATFHFSHINSIDLEYLHKVLRIGTV